MRKLALVLALLSLSVLALASVPSALADACTCPWQVRQLNSYNSGGCALATQNAQQNAGAWASFACPSSPVAGACTFIWTDLGCTTDENGGGTDVSLINFKCNSCP